MTKLESTKRRKVRKVSITAVEEDGTLNAGPQVDSVIEVTGRKSNVTVTFDTQEEAGEDGEPKNGSQKMSRGEKKRKAVSTTEASPAKKTKLINDGFCIFVGNLNNQKKAEEISDALAQYFMMQSLLVQSVRVDRSRKHAYVDLASEMDVTKALALAGETVLDKPMKVEKAKVKSAEKAKVSAEDKKAIKDSRCLYLKNVPCSTTKEDLMRIFKAVDVRFPGGTEGPTKGIAFLEFKKESVVKKIMRKSPQIKIQDRVLVMNFVGKANASEATEAEDKKEAKAPAAPNHTLFVSNLPYRVKEAALKALFKEAVRVDLPELGGRKRGFAFVQFATVAAAEKALKSAQSMKIRKREIRAEFCQQQKSHVGEELTKTLIVMGLSEKTTAETLKMAFEGSVSARVIVDKKTRASKRFGFVDFESEDVCAEAKKAMGGDCQIDDSKVTVAYARSTAERSPSAPTDPPLAEGATPPSCDAGPSEGEDAVL